MDEIDKAFEAWWKKETAPRPDGFPIMAPYLCARAAWYASRSSMRAEAAKTCRQEAEQYRSAHRSGNARDDATGSMVAEYCARAIEQIGSPHAP